MLNSNKFTELSYLNKFSGNLTFSENSIKIHAYKIAYEKKLKAKLKKKAQSDCLEFILVLEKSFCLRKKVNF